MDESPPEIPGYDVTELLGAGATSLVWRAQRESDGAEVAVKVLPGEAEEAAVREFGLLQQAAHEHVVTLHETLAVDGPQGPATALVLELLTGGSLAAAVRARGHLTPGETVTIIAPIAQALTRLHDRGIVHGDLSPGNVLLTSTGRPVLSDLGFSRLTGEPPGEVHGTDGYIAPEVLEGGEPTRASDVHALGALAWLCLTGAPPGHVTERADLQSFVPDSPELVEMIRSALAGDPASRPEAHEMALAVFDAAPAEPVRMTTSGDVASGLTRRIRESAAEGALEVPQWQRELMDPPPTAPTRRWWQRRPRAGRTRAKGGRPLRRPARHAAPASGATPRAQDPLSPGRAIARDAVDEPRWGRWSVPVAIVVALALAVLLPWQLAGAGDVSGDPTDAPAEATVAAADDDRGVRADRTAPRSDPTRLARELTRLREQMVLDLDTEVLRELDEPGSPAAQRDRELIESLTASGTSYRGVDLAVRSAQLEREEGRLAVLRATTDSAAYTVHTAQGERERAATHGEQVELVLVWHEDAWRVRDVR